MKRKNNKVLNLEFSVNVDLHQLAYNITNQLHNDQGIEKFIVLLDRLAEDWEVTNNLIQHFKAVEQEMIECLPPTDYDLTPKKIKL
jgi:hypothetical protein